MINKRSVTPGRAAEKVARWIKKQISTGSIKSGQRLPAEREMALKFETSRVSVREAYQSLEGLGLLVIRRGAEGGAFVTEIDHEPVMRSLSLMLELGKTNHREITEARLLVEPPTARLAALRASRQQIEKLSLIVDQQENALNRQGNYRPFDLQFHRAIAECSRNLPLMILMHSLADLTLEMIADLDLPAGTQHKVCSSHRAIVDAVRARDGQAAFDLMFEHVTEIQARLGDALSKKSGARVRDKRSTGDSNAPKVSRKLQGTKL